MKKILIWILVLILLISSAYAIPRYTTLGQLYRLDRLFSLNQSGNNITADYFKGNVIVGGVNVTPSDYLKNGTDASLKNLNVTNLNVTDGSDFNGTMDLHSNPIKNKR